jgi:hypothetical protein
MRLLNKEVPVPPQGGRVPARPPALFSKTMTTRRGKAQTRGAGRPARELPARPAVESSEIPETMEDLMPQAKPAAPRPKSGWKEVLGGWLEGLLPPARPPAEAPARAGAPARPAGPAKLAPRT